MRQALKSKSPGKGPVSYPTKLVAPILGWNTRDSAAATKRGYASVLDNLFPSNASVGLRGGKQSWKTGFADPIKTLHSYTPATGTKKLFAATDAGLYDATASGAVGAAASVLTNGACQSVNFATPGTIVLVVVNGHDDYRYFNGTTWTTVATFTLTSGSGGGTVDTDTLGSIAMFKRRIFLGVRGGTDVYSLPINSFTGEVDLFPLGPLFDKGGSLYSIGTWTIDGGNGIDDRIIFLSSEGQAAVFQGTDPTSASAWALVGVYNLARPLGVQPFIKFGGDVLYLSQSGLFPVSKALQSELVTNAVSDLIAPTFSASASAYKDNFGWSIAIDDPNSMLVVNVPTASATTAVQYVMNTVSDAWTRFTNWDALCFFYHDGQLYMGESDRVSKVNTATSDDGANIVGEARQAFDYFGSASGKFLNALRPTVAVNNQIAIEAALDTDFQSNSSFGPTAFFTPVGGTFDADDWDAASWASGSTVLNGWITVPSNEFFCAAIRLRFTSGLSSVTWTSTDVILQNGALMG